jgi:quinol monooxygenase YgiN
MIFIELVFDATVDTRQDVADLAGRTAAATQREEGCILYRFSTDLDLPDRFVLTELWENEDRLKAHFQGAPFKSFWDELPAGGSFVSSTAWEGPLSPYIPGNPTE